jgi:hypothetical protein
MERFRRGRRCVATTVLGGAEKRRLEEKIREERRGEEKIRTEDERTEENRGEEKLTEEQKRGDR